MCRRPTASQVSSGGSAGPAFAPSTVLRGVSRARLAAREMLQHATDMDCRYPGLPAD